MKTQKETQQNIKDCKKQNLRCKESRGVYLQKNLVEVGIPDVEEHTQHRSPQLLQAGGLPHQVRPQHIIIQTLTFTLL